MADLTVTTKTIRNDNLHPCVIDVYTIASGETITAGDVVAVSSNEIVEATTETAALRIAIESGTAGEEVACIASAG